MTTTENEGIFSTMDQYQLMLGLILVALVLYVYVRRGQNKWLLTIFIIPGLMWIYFVSYKDLGLYRQIETNPFDLVSILLLAGPILLALFAFKEAGLHGVRKKSEDYGTEDG